MSKPVTLIASSSDDKIGIGTLLVVPLSAVLVIEFSDTAGHTLEVSMYSVSPYGVECSGQRYSVYDISVVYDDGKALNIYESELANTIQLI